MNILILIVSMAAMALAEEAENPEQLLIDGNNQFTAQMFTEVLKQHPAESVVFSAFSVLPPLAQLSLASEGASHDEILKAIGLPNDNVTKSVFPLVQSKLKSAKGVTLKMANSIYIADGFELNDDFATLSRDIFDSEVKNVDFTKSTDTAKEINTWVEDHTNNRIKDLVSPDSLDSTTRAVLVNAIYFKGNWKEKFNAALTRDRDFHVNKEKTIQVPTMYRKGDYKYGESEELDAKLLEISYEGEDTSFLVVLPNAIDGINELEEKLKDPTLLSKAAENMYEAEVEVYLPKFKIETQTNLKEALNNVGVQKLFESSNAQLNRLLKSQSNLYISDAIQKAFIEVNEEGAEAAAANKWGITYLSAVISESLKFDADHPFVFYLKEKYPLFSGVYRS